MPLVKIKNFNALINNKVFLYQPQKQKAYKKVVKMSRNDEYRMENYQTTHIIKTVTKSLVLIYQVKQIQVFLNKLISHDVGITMFLSLEISKKIF